MKNEVSFTRKANWSPLPEGNLLSSQEITKVAKAMYNRYQHVYGLTPCWGDNKKVDENCCNQVKRVLDALEMNGYKLVKANPL